MPLILVVLFCVTALLCCRVILAMVTDDSISRATKLFLVLGILTVCYMTLSASSYIVIRTLSKPSEKATRAYND